MLQCVSQCIGVAVPSPRPCTPPETCPSPATAAYLQAQGRAWPPQPPPPLIALVQPAPAQRAAPLFSLPAPRIQNIKKVVCVQLHVLRVYSHTPTLFRADCSSPTRRDAVSVSCATYIGCTKVVCVVLYLSGVYSRTLCCFALPVSSPTHRAAASAFCATYIGCMKVVCVVLYLSGVYSHTLFCFAQTAPAQRAAPLVPPPALACAGKVVGV